MALAMWDKLRIEEQVVDLLETYYTKFQFPLDVFELAEKAHIRIIQYSQPDPDLAALMRLTSGDAFSIIDTYSRRATICYNDSIQPITRQRYSIAHEIGHIRLEHDRADNRQSEAEADYFAGYLLAPHPLIIHYNLFGRTAEIFKVSQQAADIADHQAKIRSRYSSQLKPYEHTLISLSSIETPTNIPLSTAPNSAIGMPF